MPWLRAPPLPAIYCINSQPQPACRPRSCAGLRCRRATGRQHASPKAALAGYPAARYPLQRANVDRNDPRRRGKSPAGQNGSGDGGAFKRTIYSAATRFNQTAHSVARSLRRLSLRRVGRGVYLGGFARADRRHLIRKSQAGASKKCVCGTIKGRPNVQRYAGTIRRPVRV